MANKITDFFNKKSSCSDLEADSVPKQAPDTDRARGSLRASDADDQMEDSDIRDDIQSRDSIQSPETASASDSDIRDVIQSRDSIQSPETASASGSFSIGHIDLGTVTLPEMLSDQQKYHVLSTIPPALKVYPFDRQKRRFHPYWVGQFSWVRYSQSLDGVFCAPCFLFSKNRLNNEFVSSPFRNWKNATGTSRCSLNRHTASSTHTQCLKQAASFLAIMNKTQQSIKSQLSQAYDKQVHINSKALTVIVDSIQFLIKQGLALRGSNWNKETQSEDGNFTGLLTLMKTYCPELKTHFQISPRNARYLSPKIQNELIKINADFIRRTIVDECNSSQCWSIMVDETTDVSTKEQVSICVRYIREREGGPVKLEVCEEFIGFVLVDRVNAETITAAVNDFGINCGLDMDRLVGKGFDGAATMSGHVSGVSVRLQQMYPKAKYFTHCRNHALNLAIVASCNSVPDVRNFMETLKELTLFFKFSAKRKYILSEHMKSSDEDFLADIADGSLSTSERKHLGLPVLSDTRWLTRIDTIQCLLRNYRAVCEAVEKIRETSHGQSANDADPYLKRLTAFEFLISAAICQHVLQYTRPLTVALQETKCDLFKAHKMAQRLIKTLELERTDEKFHVLWLKATTIAADLGIEPTKKRTVIRQRHRENPQVGNIESHYRVAYYLAFIDHTMTHLRSRFPPELEGALLAVHLLPSNISSLSVDIETRLVKEFEPFLPNPSSFSSELATWKVHLDELSDIVRARGSDLMFTTCLAHDNQVFYPNIFSILSLLLTLPVGSCSCERSFSALRRLKTWCRSTMAQERLDAIAMGHINRDRSACPEEILKAWDRSGHRRVAIAFSDQ